MSVHKTIPQISFPTVKDAINYRFNCPMCKSLLYVNDKNLATEYYDDESNPKGNNVLSFYIDQFYRDIVSINLDTNQVILRFEDREPVALAIGLGPRIKEPIEPLYYGKYIHGLGVDCKTCCQYNFTLQIHFEISETSLAYGVLNSERITIEGDGVVHEIKNSYATNLTYYTHFDKEGRLKSEVITLIPLDLSNPKETVSRIRKLLIFS